MKSSDRAVSRPGSEAPRPAGGPQAGKFRGEVPVEKDARGKLQPGKRQGSKPLVASRARSETEFLPAALEIVETPPSPVGRAIGATIVGIFIVGLLWSCIGQIDIVATAQGRIVAAEGTKVIQPFETSVIKKILVVDGQRVKADDPLIELDTTVSEAERKHLQDDLLAAKLDVARLHAALSDNADPASAFVPPEGVNASLLEMQRQLLVSQVIEYKTKLAALDRQLAQRQAEWVTTTATIEKLKTIIPYIEQRVDIRKSLSDKELGSKITYLETVQQLNESRQELAVQKKRLEEASAAVEAMVEQRAQAVAEYRRSRLAELAEAERKSIGLREDLIKAEQRTKLQTLRAPVDGNVQQLSVHTVGGIVTPAQQLMAVVPANGRLEIEARVPNRDIGFVQPGMKAKIKIDTFNFTRYGLRQGVVLSVSHDAIVRDKPAAKPGDPVQGGAASSSEPVGQEMFYSARVSLDSAEMKVDNNLMNLTPGMAVTVEISTGSRSVISYMLSPVAQLVHDSLRER
jgi:hemolysin D